MSTGQRIKELRQRRNLTQEHMAERLGISTQGYNKLENEKTEWNLTYLKKIAQELGVSVGHLAEDEGMVVNNFGEIKDGGNNNNIIYPTYHQENTQMMQMLQDERRFWQEKFQQEQDKHQQELAYYKSIIEKLLNQK